MFSERGSGMRSVWEFAKRETVFAVSFLLALLSMAAVPPDAGYLAYPDGRTLALLFCLMIVVAGFRSLGAFLLLGEALLSRADTLRKLSLTMVLLCFFSSMLLTNDVTLITFVPFTLLVFRAAGEGSRALRLTVLETVAANLGSMATPIGNPQNIYLTSVSAMAMRDFAAAVLPYAGLSLLMLIAAVMAEKDEPLRGHALSGLAGIERRGLFRRLLPYVGLLALSLLVVFRVISWEPALLVTVLAAAALDRRLFRGADYFLLATFLCFFVFIGNMRRIPEIAGTLSALAAGREVWIGILASQIISNVPAAVLLSGFTDDYGALLTGVNLGGLGTLVASLASLISFRYYTAVYPYKKGAYLRVFTVWNLGFLAALSALAALLT